LAAIEKMMKKWEPDAVDAQEDGQEAKAHWQEQAGVGCN